MSVCRCVIRTRSSAGFVRATVASAVFTLVIAALGMLVPLSSAFAAFINPPVESDIVRLLEQATFGPNDASIAYAMSIGAPDWVDEQLAMPVTKYTAFTPVPTTRP